MTNILRTVPAMGHYGWKRDLPKANRPKYHVRRPGVTRAPLVDFRTGAYMPPILDQGQLGSCTANSVAGVIRYLQAKEGCKSIYTPSRLAIYYWERAKEGTTDQDAGATIDDQMYIVKTIGAPDERLWPYDVSKFTVKPPELVEVAAHLDTVPTEFEIDTGLDGIMDSLEQGFPVSFGFVVYNSFESAEVARTGIVPMPNQRSWYEFWKSADYVVGGHAVWICGYDINKKIVIVANSWGKYWGDNGYFYLPFDYITDPNLAGPFYSVQMVKQS